MPAATRPLSFATLVPLLALATAAAVASRAAEAAPVRLSYGGSVSGVVFNPQALGDFPLGTAVSWSFTLDDAFTGLNAFTDDVFALARQPTAGTLNVGGSTYDLTMAPLWSYSYDGTTGAINWFQFQIEGTGPVTGSGGDFFGLFFRVGPDLGLFEANIGFGYDFGAGTGTSYGYLTTTGSYRVERLAVPLPGTLPLLALGLVGLAAHRRSVTAPAARGSR